MSNLPVHATRIRVPLLALVFICSCAVLNEAQSSIPTPLPFSGNSTIVAPPLANTPYGGGPNFGQFALLARDASCSMFAVLAEINAGQPQFSVQLIQADYQDNLHQLAGLTTTPDQFPNGCPDPPSGNPAYPGYAYAGQTGGGTRIFALGSLVGDGAINIYNGTFTPMTQQVTLVQTLTTTLTTIQAIAGGGSQWRWQPGPYRQPYRRPEHPRPDTRTS